MFDRIIQFSLSHRLLVIFACIVLSGAGIYVMGTLPVDVFPEFAPPQVLHQDQYGMFLRERCGIAGLSL